MDIGAFLGSLGSNISGAALALGGGVLYKILNILYDSFHMADLVQNNAEKLGYEAGKKIYDNVISKIKDEAAREKLINDLDKAGDKIDNGWDKAIRGEKL